MTDIDSPLGRQSFSDRGNQSNVYTVDDPTQTSAEYNRSSEHFQQQDQNRQPLRPISDEEMKNYERVKEAAYKQRDMLSETQKKRFEYLAGIGRVEAYLEMGGSKFEMRSLTDGELEDVINVMMTMADKHEASFTLEIRRQTLARSLFRIDGISINEIIGSNKIEDRINLIKQLDDVLVSALYKKYESDILAKTKEYAIKNDADVKEIVDTVKK